MMGVRPNWGGVNRIAAMSGGIYESLLMAKF